MMEWRNDDRPPAFAPRDGSGTTVHRYPPGFAPSPPYGAQGPREQGSGRFLLAGSGRDGGNRQQEDRPAVNQGVHVRGISGGSFSHRNQVGGRRAHFHDGDGGSRNGWTREREATADIRQALPLSRNLLAPPGFPGQHPNQNTRPTAPSEHPSFSDLNSIAARNGGGSEYRPSEARQVQVAPADIPLAGDPHGGNREDPGARFGGVTNGRGRGAGSSNGQHRMQRGRGFGNPGRARYMPNLHGGGGTQNAAGNAQDGSSSLQVSLAAARDAATEALNGISLNARIGISNNFQPGADRNGRAGNGAVNWRVVTTSVPTQPVASAEIPLNPMRGFPKIYQKNGKTPDEVGETNGPHNSRASNSGVPHLVQELQEKLTKGQLECMICYDMVGRKAAVWSCASCYSVFHLACIKKWARAPTSADLSVSGQGQAYEGNWRCPGCQSVQLTSAKDLRYECFCGQVEEPPVNYYLTPHSCGDTCQKPLDKGKIRKCQHQCTMQCHPGPCPPCMTLLPPHPCPCGKTMLTRRCSDQQKGPDSCGQICGRTLLCGRHSCRGICHDGPCEICEVGFTARCFCVKKEQLTACGKLEFSGDFNFDRGLFSCGSICGAMLSCGQHQCMERCHEGNCGECELSLSQVQTCPCGKQSLHLLLGQGKRTSCIDPIPTCGEVCGKLLPCKKHVCESACHMGPCPKCTVPSEQKCRCGSSTRSVPCHVTYEVSPDQLKDGEADRQEYLCERNCGKKKNCGRHRCNSRCCKGAAEAEASQGEQDPHLCLLKCGKRLRCKQHDCQELCHAGHCPPCLESTFTELSCACGGTSVLPPVACGTPLPSCQYPCSIPQGCGHMPTHLCHFGDCPPCSVPVAKECVGNHVILRGVPCGSREIKCNNHCGKPRHCGLHACARTCHAGPCDMPMDGSEKSSGQSVAGIKSRPSCGQPCGAPRRDCSHTCSSACHPSTSCPESRCRVLVTIACSCGRLTADVPCDAGGSKAGAGMEAVLPPHLALQHTDGTSRIPLGQRKLACDDKCAKLEKKRILADAFGAVPPGEPINGAEGGVVGSELLSEVVRREPQWIAAVEDRFKYLLLGSKAAAGSGVRVHVFCALPRERREVIHQLGERWGLAVTGVGREPRRFLVAYVTAKSKAPARSLTTRAPLPSSGQALAPLFNPAVDMEPGLVVALFELPREADVSTLVLRFGGECELVWVNDKNALAVFGDAARAATALRRVDHASAYRGAIVMSQAGSSVFPSRPNPWGPTSSASVAPTVGVSTSKASLKKKGPRGSNWVEDAWGEESAREESKGAWQRKQVPISVSRNPWGALEQTGRSNDSLQQPPSSSSRNGITEADGMPSGTASPVITTEAGPPPMLPADVDDDWEKAAD